MRANEVARLRLEDIDWHGGIIRLAANKSRRTDVLPLPAETGRAIAAYLSMERPVTANRAVFVRHVAPYDDPIGPGVVRKIVIAGIITLTQQRAGPILWLKRIGAGHGKRVAEQGISRRNHGPQVA
jgi:integrase